MTTPRRCLSRLISSFINATTVYTAFSCNDPLPSAAKKLPVFEIYYFIRVREVNSRIDPRQFVFDEKKKKGERNICTQLKNLENVVTRREISKLGLMELHVTRIQGSLEDKQVESSSRYYKTDLTSKNNLFRGDNRVTKNC